MQATLITRSGAKIRTATQRRYVLIAEYVPGSPTIIRRSDSIVTIQDVARNFRTTGQVFDTTTGSEVSR